MRAVQKVVLVALVLTAVMVFAPVGAATSGVPSASAGSGTGGSLLTAGTSPDAVGTAAATGTALNVASQMATHALAATAAAGLNPRVISVPRPSASAAQVAEARSLGYVVPLYTGVPAPVGLAYYGLSEGAQGSVVPTILNTTSLWGQVDMQGSGIQPLDLFDSSPDSYGIQLNAVQTNVTLFGTPGYSFWTQNVVLLYPESDFLVLITNVWNFSGLPISSNALYASGTYGVDDFSDYGLLGYYYSELVVPFPVAPPFDLSLYMNSTVMEGRNAVLFTVGVSSSAYPSEDFSVPYDYVIFNSTVNQAVSAGTLTVPSNYTANGFAYNPIGLTDDFELILGGPDSGSQADIATADATMALAYWDAATSSYQPTPSAFNYGGETGETVTGANVAWASGSGGPSGIADYGTVTGGPTILRGLWNAGAPEGSVPVTVAVTPANAFYIVTAVNSSVRLRNFLYAEPVAVPGVFGNTFYLTPGTYQLTVELSDYMPVSMMLQVGGHWPVRFALHLQPNWWEGVYTPLFAFSNAELRAISFGGSGTPWDPYILFNNQRGALSSVFGLYNDYRFPVFPGVFLYGTTASVALEHSASFVATTNTYQFPGQYLPSTNQLQFWFWNVTNVLLAHSEFTGWFGSSTYYPAVFDTFNVVFYESSHNLIAANDFATESEGLLLFSGGTIFGAVNVGGGNNTIWGNTFTEVAPPSSTLAIAPIWYGLDLGLGIEVAEQNDLFYNNYVATPTTAWMLPMNLYSGDPFYYTDMWNISKQPAFIPHWVAGFPLFPLVGSIVGSHYQGGNFWWDYGTTASSPNPYNGAINPIGVLPYDENATTWLVYVYGPYYYYATFIYNGGDFVPLVPSAHY